MKAVNDAHSSEYNVLPDIVVRAPCRFHLIGEHSWFFKDKTLSMAVNLPVYIAISKRNDSNLRFYFHQFADRKKSSVSSIKLKKEDRWANVIKAMLFGFTSGGFQLSGMDFTIYSEILPSAGFGITSAIKAGCVFAVNKLLAFNCTDSQLLSVIERGNKRFLGVNNYISDNFTAMFAKKNSLLLTDHFKNSWDYIPFSFEGKKIFLVDTKVPRVSVWNEDVIFQPEYVLLLGDLRETKNHVYGGWKYEDNVTEINEVLSVVSEEKRRKLLSVMREHQDILDAKDGVEKGDFFKFARAVNHSHETMRDLYNISCPEIDWILKRVNELEPNLDFVTQPVTCGRITGKGFGRCVYAIVRDDDEENFRKRIAEFEKIFGFHPDVYEVSASDGVSFLSD